MLKACLCSCGTSASLVRLSPGLLSLLIALFLKFSLLGNLVFLVNHFENLIKG